MQLFRKNTSRSPKPRKGKRKCGLAAMSAEKRSEISRLGAKRVGELGKRPKFTSKSGSDAGKSAHEKGTAHRFTKEEAKFAGDMGVVMKTVYAWARRVMNNPNATQAEKAEAQEILSRKPKNAAKKAAMTNSLSERKRIGRAGRPAALRGYW